MDFADREGMTMSSTVRRVRRVPVASVCAILLLALLLAAVGLPGGEAAQPPAAAASGDDPCTGLPLPSELRFEKDRNERRIGDFFRARCYETLGWHHDRQIRFTGPSIARLDMAGGAHWVSDTYGTHDSVAIYYSPDVFRWMCEREIAEGGDVVEECRGACPECREYPEPASIAPIADGEIIAKLMYGPTTPELLQDPALDSHDTEMIAFMVKDSQGAHDGWWWGSWSPTLAEGKQLDWPPPVNFPYPWQGFGYYCVNCHASAESELTFSDPENVLGDPEDFPTFLFQDPPPAISPAHGDAAIELVPSHHTSVAAAAGDGGCGECGGPPSDVNRVSQPLGTYAAGFTELFATPGLEPPEWSGSGGYAMPPEPYDHVWYGPGDPAMFVTSDQCVGCHAAGSTGIQTDMTLQPPDGGPLVNIAPYGEWRASPMGLAGRDPIFLSQLETEQTLHAGLGDVVPDLCLHCHGVMGQRQFCRDQFPDDPSRCSDTGARVADPDPRRELFNRGYLDAVPLGADTPEEQAASVYGALARDGVSCTVCHHTEVDQQVIDSFGETFTGDFRLGAADELMGPFPGPRQVPMDHALGVQPVHDPRIANSRVCGSCHSVVLPVYDGDVPWNEVGTGATDGPEFIIEQATYPEWVFSDFHDGGPRAESCQGCHMQSAYPGADSPLESKIASIQEASNFPVTAFRLPKEEIDLDERSPFARHTLVGLNVFFIKMAQQFPDVLGIRVSDPMLGGKGIAPLATAYRSMVEQAETATAEVDVTAIRRTADSLEADVRVRSMVGHKFPSGVGFRRAFLEFAVLDGDGDVLWASGRTSGLGVLVDGDGAPLAGELWWKAGCVERTVEEERGFFQPHYEVIDSQDQAQIYQELVRNPDHEFTTSFLSIAHTVKDNRLLPPGWEPTLARAEKYHLGSERLSAEALVEDVQAKLPDGEGGTVDDPWYVPRSKGGLGGGGDELTYRVPLAGLDGEPAQVRATLYSQSIPPFYLQDRFCTTPAGRDTQRLYFLAGHLDLEGTEAEGWKLRVVSSGDVGVPVGALQ